jgi:hypothetical protein
MGDDAFEYPRHVMRCNDWRLDLFPSIRSAWVEGRVCHNTKGLLVSVFEMSNDTGNDRSILVRIVLAFVGLGIALLGWTLMMTVFLVFIGLPLFIVGLAIAQAQES